MLIINNRLSRVIIVLGFLGFISLFTYPLSHAIEETHSFILYTSEDIDSIRERLFQKPNRSWFSRVVDEADMILHNNVDWNQTVVPKITQRYYAKMLAFVYAFTDSSSEHHVNYRYPSTIEGYVQAEESTDTQITVYNVEALYVSYRNESVPFDTLENGVSFTISGEVELKIEHRAPSTKAEPEEQLLQFTIEQPFPNPFNSSTVLNYYLPQNSAVSLVIYSITGGKIAVLDEGYRQS